MKIPKYYNLIAKDSDTPTAKAVNSELKWMLDQIMADYDQLWKIRKALHYKEQMFKAFYRSKNGAFNRPCPISSIIKDCANGLLDPAKLNTKESKDLVAKLITNFFPQWMWEGLEFSEVMREGWTTTALALHFIWSTGKGKSKKRLEFQVHFPNPEMIKTNEMFECYGAFKVMDEIGYENFKTKVYVNTDTSTDAKFGKTFSWVGEGYLNDDIRASIDQWMTDNGFKKEK